ncbi:hypothetical protein V5F49_20205 [Xanthobacter sp. V3C-3]|uniref:hypothetical protein n=1 Tax=Xanthobacter lutulentifluminis TaxID=3119935 RepID=UPI00372CE65D
MASEPRVKSPAEQFRDTFRAGRLAGLREAVEYHEAEAAKVQPAWPPLASVAVPEAEALAIRRDISGHNRWSAMVFRARIAELEEEAGLAPPKREEAPEG